MALRAGEPEKPADGGRPKPRVYSITLDASAGTLIPGGDMPERDARFKTLHGEATAITPPFEPVQLRWLCDHNSILRPSVEIYVKNIAGTGSDFVSEDEEELTPGQELQRDMLQQFVDEPWPDTTLILERKKQTRDKEETGNSYFEVLRSLDGKLKGLRRLDPLDMRFVELDAPVPVKRTVMRDGKEETLTFDKRERRFVMCLTSPIGPGSQEQASGASPNFIYFKEMGSSRDLDKTTGKWAKEGEKLAANLRANEVLHIGTGILDSQTPYHLPRWISNIPSVYASRNAEDFNNNVFQAGGVPPGIIFIHGGSVAEELEQELSRKLADQKRGKHQLIVVEVHGEGDVDSPNKVGITVERFGAPDEDASFQSLGTDADAKVRRSFQLPGIFYGEADSYSFATAFASVVATEGQVFSPERQDFDSVFNLRILPELTKDMKVPELPEETDDAIDAEFEEVDDEHADVKAPPFGQRVEKKGGFPFKKKPNGKMPEDDEETAAFALGDQVKVGGKSGTVVEVEDGRLSVYVDGATRQYTTEQVEPALAGTGGDARKPGETGESTGKRKPGKDKPGAQESDDPGKPKPAVQGRQVTPDDDQGINDEGVPDQAKSFERPEEEPKGVAAKPDEDKPADAKPNGEAKPDGQFPPKPEDPFAPRKPGDMQKPKEKTEATALVFRSKPLTMRDATQILAAAGVVKDMVTPESLVETINDVVSVALVKKDDATLQQEAEQEAKANAQFGGPPGMKPGGGLPSGKPNGKFPPGQATDDTQGAEPGNRVTKADRDRYESGLREAAREGARLLTFGVAERHPRLARLWDAVQSMTQPEYHAFEAMLAAEFFPQLVFDPRGAAELASCALEMEARR